MAMDLVATQLVHATHWLSRAEVADDREDIIAQYVRYGDVLDLGVVDSRRGKESTADRLVSFATGLHEFIRRLNPGVMGVDIDEEGVALLRGAGYNVICADVETMELDREFDTIVAGELIEHLPNPGRALASLRQHLRPDGRLILTTCNPFYLRQFFHILRGDDIRVHEEHTAWFDPHTLGRLLRMHGFEVERLCWLRKRRRHGRWQNWPARLRKYFHPNFLMVARPERRG